LMKATILTKYIYLKRSTSRRIIYNNAFPASQMDLSHMIIEEWMEMRHLDLVDSDKAKL
jgi:hypothetical protein